MADGKRGILVGQMPNVFRYKQMAWDFFHNGEDPLIPDPEAPELLHHAPALLPVPIRLTDPHIA